MEFWGVEVKPGETVKCAPGEEKYIHLSQASLGESKDRENVVISVKVDDKKLVIGSLSLEKCTQIPYDLVFEKEFELSHSSKKSSVYFCGYRSGPLGEDSEEEDSESEEDEPIGLTANGKSVVDQDEVKPSGSGKAKAVKEDNSTTKKAEPTKVDNSNAKDEDSDDDDEDDSDEGSDEESDDDEDLVAAMKDSDDEDDDEDESSEEEDDVTPKKAATGKRPAESASKTPVPEKKAKIVTPAGAKTGGDGKKNVHIATPHPAKRATKTPANNDKSKQQTPKSAGSISCKTCSRTFNSDSALQAHTKAKHA